MLKPFLLFSSVLLFGLAALPAPGRIAQEPTPTPAPAPTPGPTPAATQAPTQAPTPPAASALKNPVKPTPESQAKAKKLYDVDCAMCHGANGNGKTDLAKDLQLTLLDWTSPNALSSKSDGELFEMIRKGKDKMPAEDAARAKDDDVWNLIIYIRNFSKEHPAEAAKPAN